MSDDDDKLVCSCPQDHFVLPVAAQNVLLSNPRLIDITTGQGTFRVPRAFIAYHGIIGAEIPALAETYGWEKV